MAIDTAALIAGATCIDRCIPPGMRMAVLIAQFANQLGMTTDPATLMNQAVCIDRCIPDGMKMAVLISLLSQIQQSTAAATGATVGVPDPNGVVSGNAGALYFATSDNTLWINLTGANGGWAQLV